MVYLRYPSNAPIMIEQLFADAMAANKIFDNLPNMFAHASLLNANFNDILKVSFSVIN